jgi:hypothetical protein
MRYLALIAAATSGVLFWVEGANAQTSLRVNGVTYVDVAPVQEYADSVLIKHSAGRTFVNKADLHPYQASELGVAKPAPPPAARPRPTPSSPKPLTTPRPTPHPSPYIEKADPTPVQGGPQFVRGSMGQWEPVRTLEPAIVPAGFPEEWGGRPAGNSARARKRQQEWDEQRAFQIASQAGPEAMQSYIERRGAAKTQRELENLRMQQNQLQGQIQQMQWQQQLQSSEMQRMEWER